MGECGEGRTRLQLTAGASVGRHSAECIPGRVDQGFVDPPVGGGRMMASLLFRASLIHRRASLGNERLSRG